MRAGYIEKPEVAYFKEVKEPQIVNDTDVKIQVKVTGICGSEVHAFHGKHPFRIPPIVSGHEFAGVIVEVGSAVTKYKVGDRVKIDVNETSFYYIEIIALEKGSDDDSLRIN